MADLTRGFFIEARGISRGMLLNGTVSAGDPIGQDGTGWVRADADAVVSCQAFAMQDGVSGDRIDICQAGLYQTTTTLTQGAMIFLSATVGRLSDTDPGASAAMTQVVGWVVGASPSGLIELNANIQHVEATWSISLATLVVAGQFINFFIARRPYRVLGAVEVHSVAGSDGSAVTADVEKIPSGTAKASGTRVLSTTFNLKSTANTVVWLGPNTTAASARLATGDRLGVISSGTLTSVIDSCITVQLVALER